MQHTAERAAEPRPGHRRLNLKPGIALWALGCGALAASGGRFTAERAGDLVIAAAMVIGWCAWFDVCESVPWATLVARWRAWRLSETVVRVPYAVPGSAADRATMTLGRLRAWLRHDFVPNFADVVGIGAAAAIVSAVLGAVHSVGAFISSMAVIGLGVLISMLLASERWAPAARRWVGAARGCVTITLPALIGWLIFGEAPAGLWLAATVLGLACSAASNTEFNTLYGALMLTMIAGRHTVGAFVLALVWVPHFLLQATPPSATRSRTAGRWHAAAILAATLAFS